MEIKILGVHKGENVYLVHDGVYGKGPYLKYNGKQYSIPEWAKQENLNEMFNLYHAVKIIDYKIKKQLEESEQNLFDTYCLK